MPFITLIPATVPLSNGTSSISNDRIHYGRMHRSAAPLLHAWDLFHLFADNVCKLNRDAGFFFFMHMLNSRRNSGCKTLEETYKYIFKEPQRYYYSLYNSWSYFTANRICFYSGCVILSYTASKSESFLLLIKINQRSF